MITRYNEDMYSDLGFTFVKKKSLHLDTKAIINFANENWVTTFSNWTGIAFGAFSLLVMVVL